MSNLVQIYVFIGLPGSGKTQKALHLCNHLESQQLSCLYIDDLYMQLKDHKFNWEALFPHKDYQCVLITDFLACNPKQQMFLFNQLQSLFPQSEQHWNFFNNEPQQCVQNIAQRNNGLDVSITLSQMTKIYAISTEITEHASTVDTIAVYNPKHFEHVPTICKVCKNNPI